MLRLEFSECQHQHSTLFSSVEVDAQALVLQWHREWHLVKSAAQMACVETSLQQ